MTHINHVEVDERQGQRIDNFLLSYFHYKAPKSLIYRLIRKGVIRVNKKRITPSYKLQLGDIVKIPNIEINETKQTTINREKSQFLEDYILYEDEYFIVLNKPHGLAVHGGSGIDAGLIERLRTIRPDEKRLELVHRLDKATSGCIIIAKKHPILTYFHELLISKNIKKIYHAIVFGKWPKTLNKIDLPLYKFKRPSGEHAVKVSSEGKPSLTTVNIIKSFNNQATLVEARPLTGRTHQLRVHLAHNKHPIIGDEKYANEQINNAFYQNGHKRLFLHAHELRFNHPINKKPMLIKAPYDDAFIACLDDLSNSTD
ncbi:RluA family pseudouridine synthase [Thiotrichales bacterium 19S3-7]|nr:RluA family pseudouridine synthase [Thiotrichales bacterium 19S3-7]MCF6801600.1 RluA family pseudouridine synthase [Thiotrichales bacterium 19S3-11]